MNNLSKLYGFQENNFPNSKEINILDIKYDDIVFSLFPFLKCMNCGMHKRNYHCIPVPYLSYKKELKKYNTIKLILLQRNIDKRTKEVKEKVKTEYNALKFSCNAEVASMKRVFNKYMNELYYYLNNNFGDNFKLFGYGGGCRGCRDCGLKNKETCRKPTDYFRAPESVGIDLYKMMVDLKYKDFQIIPKNFVTLIGMVAYNV